MNNQGKTIDVRRGHYVILKRHNLLFKITNYTPICAYIKLVGSNRPSDKIFSYKVEFSAILWAGKEKPNIKTIKLLYGE